MDVDGSRAWRHWFTTGGHLTPDTEPGAIAAGQRAEVAAFLAAHPNAPVEAVSAALVLSVWSVRCRLAELRGEPVPYTNPKRAAA